MENASDFNIEKCIFELVANSLAYKATSVAIRFHTSKQKIQVIDNGIGISKYILRSIGENSLSQNYVLPRSFIFEKICQRSKSLSITSRTTNSSSTYIKDFQNNSAPVCYKASFQRPSSGTTITIQGLKNVITEDNKLLIPNAVGTIALFYTNVSFTVRDDEAMDVVLGISKHHPQESILQYICDQSQLKKTYWNLFFSTKSNTNFEAHFGLIDSSMYLQKVFVNSKLASCSEIEHLLTSVLQKVYNNFFENSLNRNIFYIIYIECSATEFSFYEMGDKINVQFRNSVVNEMLKQHLKKNVIKPLIKGTMAKFYCDINKKDCIPEHKDETKTVQSRKRKQRNVNFCIKNMYSYYYTRRTPFGYRKKLRKTFTKAEKIAENQLILTENFEESDVETTKNQLIFADNFEETNEKKNFEQESDLEKYSIPEWSDWEPEVGQNVTVVNKNICLIKQQLNNQKLYSFLPLNLQHLLQYKNHKVVKQFVELSQDEINHQFETNDNLFKKYRQLGIRNMEKNGKVDEFVKIKKECLYNFKVLGQINLEFIAALTIQDDQKLLLLIDQHAVDERIRYEQLLEVYRIFGKTDEYVSEILQTPIIITDISSEIRDILSRNLKLLKKYGIKLATDDNKITIYSVPLCFQSRKSWNDEYRLLTFTKKLLIEIAESLLNGNSVMILPNSIHLAIATEACRGAIKFGHPLNIKQCTSLLEALRYTNGFSRCAHGRPSIIPLLNLTNLKTGTKKLNFSSLMERSQIRRKNTASFKIRK